MGVDGVEIDVHVCASGEPVVFHDITLDRMTNGTGEISDFTLTELKRLRVEHKYLIPTLTEVLDLIDKKCLLNIELKGKNTAIAICNLMQYYIKNHGWQYEHFIVSSFQHSELKVVFEMDKNVRLGVLSKAGVDETMDFAKTISAYSIHPNHALVSAKNVESAQSQNLKVIVWTVNDPDRIKKMKICGVDGIISDKPDQL